MVGDGDHRADRAKHALGSLHCRLEVAEQVGESRKDQIPQGVLGDVAPAKTVGEQLGPQRGVRGQRQQATPDIARGRYSHIRQPPRRAAIVGYRHQSRYLTGVTLDRLEGGRLAMTTTDCGDDRAVRVEEQRLESGRSLCSHRLMSRWRTAAVTSCSARRRPNSSAMATER